MKPELTQQVFNKQEAATILGVSVPTIERYVARKLLRCLRPSYRVVRFTKAHLEQFMKRTEA